MERNSKKREAILRVLAGTTSHPGAEWIYSQLKPEIPELSLGTVYTNLATFKKKGDAISVAIVDGKERFDGNTKPHAHFICTKCGVVVDLWDIQLPTPSKFHGEIESCQLNYYGLCEDCSYEKFMAENGVNSRD